MKDMQKLSLLCYAKDHGPKIDTIVRAVQAIGKGKDIIGYHLPLKLSDLGIKFNHSDLQLKAQQMVLSKFSTSSMRKEARLERMEKLGFDVEKLFDVAKIFNRDGQAL